MRAYLACLVVLAGCATGAAPAPNPQAGTPVLSMDLLPFEASSAPFTDTTDPAPRTLRIEPAADGASARLLLEMDGIPPRELRATRRDGSVFLSGGMEEGTELIRAGARAGDTWESGGRRVTFEGWERVSLPTVTYDAAKISTRRGPPGVEQVETWWFAPGVGLVRLRSDHGTLFVDELIRSPR